MTALTLVIGNKNYSSWSLRPWLAMKQLGLQFHETQIILGSPNSADQIRQYSPSAKVPVLLHDHQIVWDSLAICEYLAELFPSLHWWPSNQTARAFARSISAEMHSGFLNLRQNMPMNCRAKYPGKGLTPGVQQDIDRIMAIWQEARQKFGFDGSFLLGQFTIADAFLVPVVLRFVTYDVQLNAISQSYVETILALPAVQEWIAAAKNEEAVIPQYEF